MRNIHRTSRLLFRRLYFRIFQNRKEIFVTRSVPKLQFGNLEHILLLLQVELRSLEGEGKILEAELSRLMVFDKEGETYFLPRRNKAAFAQISEKIAEINAKIDAANAAINATRAERLFIQKHRVA